jgi:hypothetical protein
MTAVKFVARSVGSRVRSSLVMFVEISRCVRESGPVVSIAALLEILYLIVPGAYLKDDAPVVGATGTAG